MLGDLIAKSEENLEKHFKIGERIVFLELAAIYPNPLPGKRE
jgi:hypothetical protein